MMVVAMVAFGGLVVANSLANTTAYTFTTIDATAAAKGINDNGQIVGDVGGGVFIETGASFTIFDVPGATNGLFGSGIDDRGQVVWTFIDSKGNEHGYFRDTNGSIRP